MAPCAQVNFRLNSLETVALGAETHICEVQLLLKSMGVIKVFLPIFSMPMFKPSRPKLVLPLRIILLFLEKS